MASSAKTETCPGSAEVSGAAEMSSAVLSRAPGLLHLAQKNPHPRDKNVKFFEEYMDEEHVYLVHHPPILSFSSAGEWNRACTSVTGVKSLVVPEFDADAAITAMKKSRLVKWPRKEYMHKDGRVMTDDEIKAKWEENRDFTASRGTHVHAVMEKLLNGDIDAPDRDKAWPKYSRQGKLWFERVTEQGWTPYRSEWVIYMPLWENTETRAPLLWRIKDGKTVQHRAPVLCGSIDGVFIDKEKKFHLVDFKCCSTKGLAKEYKNNMCLPPMEHLYNNKLTEWHIQANLYRYILVKYYGMKISSMSMVVIGEITTEKIPINEMDVSPLIDILVAKYGHGGPIIPNKK